jgi:hypothetical protein
MIKNGALRLALEALDSQYILGCGEWRGQQLKAITALREALAQPAQEPVAWMRPSEEGYDSAFRDHSTVMACTGNPWTGWAPLYTTPPAAVMGIPTTGDYAMGYAEGFNDACKRPAQKPDIYPEEARDMGLEAVAYYTTPPAAPVQDGWILVPVTITNAMTSAMADALEDPNNERSSWDLAEAMWRAMLTKAPTPPAQPAQEPIYQMQMMDGKWIDQAKQSYESNKTHGHTMRIVYTTPPAATKEKNT